MPVMLRKYIGTGIFIAVACFATYSYAEPDCESWQSGFNVATVMENGWTIQLSDGSIWRVKERDTLITKQWLPNDEIEICDENKLTNTRDGATIHVKKMR